MLLRRVIARLRNQEWTAVAIDLVIVVLGVFLGLQASNWNAARDDRASELLYLGYLAEDFEDDLHEIDHVISVTGWRLSALAAVITTATGEPMPATRATPDGAMAINPVPAYAPTTPQSVVMAMSLLVTFDSSDLAYQTLVSTGGIRLVRNPELARRMQAYYAAVRDLQRIETRLTTYRDGLAEALQRAGVAWIDELSVDEAAEVARDHPEVLAAMKNFWAFNDWHLSTLRRIRTLAAELQVTAQGEASH
ncbi:MAG: hypothetical protein AB7E72_18220 [Lysobacterales bacterium]